MAVMGFLRERMGKILAIGIGVALFAFVGEEAIRQGSSLFKDDRNEIGEVAGEKVAYDDFSKKMDQNTAQLKQQMNMSTLTAQFTNYAQENTWNQEVSE